MPSGRIKQNDSIMRKEGRKTKYTPELVKRICGLVEKDTYTVSELCESVGISETTFYDWKVKFSEFSDAIKKAEERRLDNFVVEAKRSLLKKIQGYEVKETHTVTIPGKEKDEEGKPKPIIKEQKTIKKTYPAGHGGDHLRPYQPRPGTLEKPAAARRQHSERCAFYRIPVGIAECPGYRGSNE